MVICLEYALRPATFRLHLSKIPTYRRSEGSDEEASKQALDLLRPSETVLRRLAEVPQNIDCSDSGQGTDEACVLAGPGKNVYSQIARHAVFGPVGILILSSTWTATSSDWRVSLVLGICRRESDDPVDIETLVCTLVQLWCYSPLRNRQPILLAGKNTKSPRYPLWPPPPTRTHPAGRGKRLVKLFTDALYPCR